MRDIERRTFIARCDRNGLPASACVLRAAVEFDGELATQRAVEGADQSQTLPEAAFDAADLQSAFRSSSNNRASAHYICNLCEQRVTMRETYDDLQDGAVEVSVAFPMRCSAFNDVLVGDIAKAVVQGRHTT